VSGVWLNRWSGSSKLSVPFGETMPSMIFKMLIVMSNDFICAKFLNNFDVSPIFSIYDLFNVIPLTVFEVKAWTNPRFKKRLSMTSVLSLHL
jgi:hypothetical protein